MILKKKLPNERGPPGKASFKTRTTHSHSQSAAYHLRERGCEAMERKVALGPTWLMVEGPAVKMAEAPAWS